MSQHRKKNQFKKEFKENKGKTIVYLVLRILVIVTLIAQAFNHEWNNVFLCVLTLILFLVPTFLDDKMNITLPNTLEIIILLFIFSAEILGEIQEYYLMFDRWDDMLHTMNGFLCAAIGFSLVDILNRSEKIRFELSPVFVAMVAFCFSMTIGVLWEFYEFSMDFFLHTDMQKDTILTDISSVLFNPTGANVAVTMPVDSMVVNGEMWNYGGYIDVGLYDTMHDLWVNFIGAVVFSTIGLFYIKGRGTGTFAARFVPKLKKQQSDNQEVQSNAGDQQGNIETINYNVQQIKGEGL